MLARHFRSAANLLVLAAAILGAAGCSSDEASDEDVETDALTAAWQGPDKFSLGQRGAALDLTTAYWMGRMAELAYAPRAQIESTLGALGVEPSRFVFFENTKTNTQGFYVAAGDDAIVVFRGTQELRDFLTDLKAWTRPTPFGKIHSGFLAAFESVWNDAAPGLVLSDGSRGLGTLLRSESARNPERRLLFTGHSLGAALATLAYAHAGYDACLGPDRPGDVLTLENRTVQGCLKNSTPVHGLYTFGAPRVGDESFSSWVSSYSAATQSREAGVYRFVRAADVVSKVPDSFGGELFFHPSVRSVSGQHTETDHLVYLTRAGGIDVGGASVEFNTDTWRTRWRDYVGDHFMRGYLDTLLKHAAEGKVSGKSALTARNERFERLKNAYTTAKPGDFVLTATGELGGVLAVDGVTELVFRWATPLGTFFVKRSNDGPDATPSENEPAEETTGHLPLDVQPTGIDEIYDSSFVLVATVETNPTTKAVERFEDPNATSRR